MRYTFRFTTRDHAMKLVKRLEKRRISSNLSRNVDGTFQVSGRSNLPAVEIPPIAAGLRFVSFDSQEEA